MKSWPYFDEDERAAVDRVLASGHVNQWTGEEVRAFEREFAEFHNVPNAVAVANGTLALDLALYALGIGPGDEVVTTPRTFIATASSIVLRGAVPVFADVDVDSQNITPEAVERVLTHKTRAILAVHLAGWPCDMDGLRRLASKRGLLLIEDCAQAHGALFRGRPVGSFGDAAAFSFCQDKIMSTGGEGGMLLIPDDAVWRRAWSYKDHGKDWDSLINDEPSHGFRWVHTSFGSNLRLTEMQAAIGRIQLRKLKEWVRIRRSHAGVLVRRLKRLEALRVPTPPDHVQPSYYKFYAFVRPDKLAAGWSRDRIIDALRKNGVACMHGSCPEVYRERAFLDTEWALEQPLPVARKLGETSLMFQVHPTLTESDVIELADCVEEVVVRATR